MNYYNDNDPFSAKWLNALSDSGMIPKGKIDASSISDISPSDLAGFIQCHFFAGIAGWSYALDLAGWPRDREVWTGSCPCQPFSVAGKGQGVDDDRHLWPAFRWLIAQRRPSTIFGEQVASKDGRKWLSGIRTDLEAMGYRFGAADLCSAGVGAPNIRQRLFWVADSTGGRFKGCRGEQFKNGSSNNAAPPSQDGRMAHSKLRRFKSSNEKKWTISEFNENGCTDGGMGNTRSEKSGRISNIGREKMAAPWGASKTIECKDGKLRRIPIEPAIFPLAPRIPGRVGLLRGAGNAINPWVAAEFIKAFMEN